MHVSTKCSSKIPKLPLYNLGKFTFTSLMVCSNYMQKWYDLAIVAQPFELPTYCERLCSSWSTSVDLLNWISVNAILQYSPRKVRPVAILSLKAINRSFTPQNNSASYCRQSLARNWPIASHTRIFYICTWKLLVDIFWIEVYKYHRRAINFFSPFVSSFL